MPEILEIILAVLGVILLLNIGLIIGREFGTFEKFAVSVLKKILSRTYKSPYMATEKIEIGSPVIIQQGSLVKKAVAEKWQNNSVVGVAARDLNEGEFIQYSPVESTDDIIIYKKAEL